MEAELINITEDGGVVKKILQPGTGEVPTDKSDVKGNFYYLSLFPFIFFNFIHQYYSNLVTYIGTL